METTASVSITEFLTLGTELLKWIVEGMGTILNFLMGNPVTACFLIVGLVYVVVRIIKRFINI